MAILQTDNEFAFVVKEEHPGAVVIELQAGRFYSWIVNRGITDSSPLPRAVIMRVDSTKGYFSIQPRRTFPKPAERFLHPKYARLREIVVEGPFDDHLLPHDDASTREFLRVYAPASFIHDPLYGLGIMKEMAPVVRTVEELRDVSMLVISERHETHISEGALYLSRHDYDNLRSASQAVSEHYQRESLEDRRILAHNAILHRALPDRFPEKARPYRAGTVFRLLGGKSATTVKLSPRDRAGLLSALAADTRKLTRTEKREAIQLQHGIELMNRNRLIAAFEKRLAGSVAESEWQDLFGRNPFILSMTLGYPISILQSHASVGGLTLQGNGTKIADFLARTETTHNAALIEIKTPRTELLGHEYRAGVFGPSHHLTGAVVQVLDQRRHFVASIATLKHNSNIGELQAHAVDCVIVAGRTPKEAARQSSFELIRHHYKDVTILTFDELLEKLKLLHALLSARTDAETEDAISHAEEALDLTKVLAEHLADDEDDDFFTVSNEGDDELF